MSRTRCNARRLGTLGTILLLTHVTGAYTQPQVVFRTGVELVEVDVIVTDDRGRPAQGLTREDFELLEDGQTVEIVSFDAIELGASDAVVPGISGDSGTAVANNLTALEGTIYLIVVDDVGLSFSGGHFQRARTVAYTLIEHLGPADQVAMLATSGNKAYQVEFTTDRDRLRRALSKFVLGLPTMENPVDFIARVSRQLGSIKHRRKVIALISENYALDPDEPQYQLAFDEAWRSNVAVYTFDPKFLGSSDRMIEAESPVAWRKITAADRASVAGLQTLAANTGGRATVRTNAIAEGVLQMMAENRSYYLLRYKSPAGRDGKFHRVAVNVRRPGLHVRARPGFTAPKPNAKTPVAPAPPLSVLLGAPVQTHGMGLRIAVLPLPSSAPTGSALAIVTEIDGADLAGASALELAAIVVDMSGRVRARDDFKAAIVKADTQSRWVRIASRINVPPGHYQVRVAARQIDGKTEGSVFVEVEVPKFSKDLSLGGLALATPDGRGVARRQLIDKFLPAIPIARNEIPVGYQTSAVLPLRLAAKHRAVNVVVVVQLVTADGATMNVHTGDYPASGFIAAEGGALLVPLPTERLAPGDYRLVVDVRCSTSERRELLFRVLPARE